MSIVATTTALPKTCPTCGFDFATTDPMTITAHLVAHFLAQMAIGIGGTRDPDRDW